MLKPKPTGDLKFGQYTGDHMMQVDWSADEGWTRPLISPLENFSIHPASKVFHCAIELIEGLKAYRGVDNQIRLFRIDKNMARMKQSALRSALPDFDGDELIKIIEELVRVDREWVPYSDTSALYIRPTMIATDPHIGVRQSMKAKLFVLTGPIGMHFNTGLKPVSLLADPRYLRAFPGGVGQFKMGCNYAPTIDLQRFAEELGCYQALWLFDADEKITEAVTMNIFVYWINENGEHELVTPPLTDGLILPGIMRDTFLTLSREWNEFIVSERYFTIGDLRRAIVEGRILQMFGTGTASGVTPIDKIIYTNNVTGKFENLYIPTMVSKANVMQRLYEGLTDIQYGRVDRPDWIHIVA